MAFLLVPFIMFHQPTFASTTKFTVEECNQEEQEILALANESDKESRNIYETLGQKYSYSNLEQANDFIENTDKAIEAVENQKMFSTRIVLRIANHWEACLPRPIDPRLYSLNEKFGSGSYSVTMNSLSKDLSESRAVAVSFTKNPTADNLRKTREAQVVSEFRLEVYCPQQSQKISIECVLLAKTSTLIDISARVNIQISVDKASWKTVSTKSIKLNENVSISIPHSLSKLKENGKGAIRAQSLFGARSFTSNEIKYPLVSMKDSEVAAGSSGPKT